MWSLEGLGPRKASLATVGRMAGKNQDSRLASEEVGKFSGPQIVGRLELVDSGGDGENQMQVKTLSANFHCRAHSSHYGLIHLILTMSLRQGRLSSPFYRRGN